MKQLNSLFVISILQPLIDLSDSNIEIADH